MKGWWNRWGELCEEVETVSSFCYLGDKVDGSGGCEAAVTASKSKIWLGEV